MNRPDPEAVVTIPGSPPQSGPEPLHEVRALRAPVRRWDLAAQHTAELMREFALVGVGRVGGTAPPNQMGRRSGTTRYARSPRVGGALHACE